jgi:hypothetical protein
MSHGSLRALSTSKASNEDGASNGTAESDARKSGARGSPWTLAITKSGRCGRVY